ncbi:MAG: PriCT-2 domain-containing protein [Nitrososphaerales archaeon]
MEDLLKDIGDQQIQEAEATHFISNTARYVRIIPEKMEEFFVSYADKVSNGIDPHIAEVCEPRAGVQLSLDLFFSFQKPTHEDTTLKDLEDDVFNYLEFFISATQSQMRNFFVLSRENSEFVCCVLRPVGNFFTQRDNTIFTNIRCIFPYAFLSRDHTIGFIEMLKVQMQLNSGKDEARFSMPPLEPIRNSIRPSNMKVRTLYGSTLRSSKNDRRLEFSNAFGDMIFSREEKALSEVFDPRLHNLVKEGYLNETTLEDYTNSYGLEHWLPLFFSQGYYGKVLRLQEGQTLPTIDREGGEETIKEEFQPFQNNLDRARSFLSMLKEFRSKQFWCWYDIGQAIFSVESEADRTECLQLWKEFSSSTATFKDEDCDRYWDEFENLNSVGKLMVTIDTLEYFAKEDNPTFYEKMKTREINDLLIKASFAQTHAKVAEAFKNCYPFDYACASHKNKTWYTFNGIRWRRIDGDADLRIRITGSFTKRLYELKLEHDVLASKAKDAQVRSTHKSMADNLGSLIGKLESEPFQNSLTNMLRSYYHKHRFLEWVDSEWSYFCCINGVIDLRGKKPVFRPGKPEDYNNLHGCKFPEKYTWDHPKVKEVMKYLREVFLSTGVRDFVLLLCASYLRSGNVNKLFTLFQGGGNNSKSVFINLISAVFQKYFVKISPEYFTEEKKDSGKANPGLARARHKKLLVAEEANKETTFKEGTIKGLTGRDKRSDRDLYEAGRECEDAEPSFNIIFSVNTPPEITDTQEAIWNRILEIVFTAEWVKGDNPRLPATYEEQLEKGIFRMDKFFEDRLPSMAPAFLWILFHKYPEYIEKGLTPPEEVVKATQRYRTRNNVYHRFTNDKVKPAMRDTGKKDEKGEPIEVIDRDAFIHVDEVYRVFKAWYIEQNLRTKCPSKLNFFEEIQNIWGKTDDKKWYGRVIDQSNGDITNLTNLLGGK